MRATQNLCCIAINYHPPFRSYSEKSRTKKSRWWNCINRADLKHSFKLVCKLAATFSLQLQWQCIHIDINDRRKGLRRHLLVKVIVLNLRNHRFLCINRSAFSQQQSFCKILLVKCFKDILTLHKTKEKEDACISASFCFVQYRKYDSKEKPSELVVKILTSLRHTIYLNKPE